MTREDFFARLADRLGRPLPATPPARDTIGASESYRAAPFGTAAGPSPDRLAIFQRECEALGGVLRFANSPADAGPVLRALLDELSPRHIVTWHPDEFAGWPLEWLWTEQGAIGPAGHTRETWQEHAASADIGITTVDFAIANTGSLVLRTTPARPRSVSLLPAVHVALIRESQLVDRLGQAYEAVSATLFADVPSSVHVISGPSRSADIENDLTIGVHGPAALTVILARNS